ncbi:hypothetical protein TSOC_014593, partial [Tetrabaena socialis]
TPRAQSTATSGYKAVVDGLSNGKLYTFTVQAYSSKFMTGGVAQVSATPSDLCVSTARPGKPTNVRVQTWDGGARLCWDGVDNDACVDEYRLSATVLDGPGFRSSPGGRKISKGGCANITGLVNDVKYQFSVVPYAQSYGEGVTGSVSAVVGAAAAGRNGWKCKSVEGCHPSRPGLCSAGGGCPAVRRMGQCGVPAMSDVDWVNKE